MQDFGDFSCIDVEARNKNPLNPLSKTQPAMSADVPMHDSATAVECKDLWFSYEVAENIGATAKEIDKAQHPKSLRDGGCSVDAPRKQYDMGTQVVKKLQLQSVTMQLPRGARCMLVGANGAGKSTLLSIVGGRHLVDQ